jgi:serine/threonine protein kinase/WD40 repeat protein
MAADIKRIKEVFLAAADLSAPVRPSFLAEACGQDAELRAAVERLLAAHDAPASLLEPPVPSADHTSTFGAEGGVGSAMPANAEHVGSLLAGKYKLVEEIGEGGMGCVYLAKQTEPVQRMVAVKLIRPGMDSRAVLARFEAERQALAVMDHPNIAKILDGGLHDNRPFFVMELVKGKPITKFCDERKLTPRERMELFVPVCQAIQHAHQKGIIHRDIKPSNVLIALYDDRPVPKVIDFGVAKATGRALAEDSVYTAFGAIVGTPEYMSPEQASLNNLDIDTRSDVYALGVLLYELLTGTTPVDRKQLGQSALLEVLRIVREVEAPRPSTKLSSSEALPSIAANRKIEPKKLSRLMKGELDWILLKALEKDRTRRYESANGLAADVQRYLAGEPVQAVPPSKSYRLGKFARKHRVALAAAGMVLLALVAGVVGTSLGLVEAVDERKRADVARESAQSNEARAVEAGNRLRDAQDELWRNLYEAQCRVISNAWEAGQYDFARELLARQVPKAGQRDQRGFESYYFDRQLHGDVLTVPFPSTPPYFLRLSPDGRRLLRYIEGPDGSWIKSFDTATGHEAFAIRIPGLDNASRPVFSPDGKRIVMVIHKDEKENQPARDFLRMWNADTGVELLTLDGLKEIPRPSVGQTDFVWAPAAGPEGRFVVTEHLGPPAKGIYVRIWDGATGKEIPFPYTRPNWPGALTASPDGLSLAVKSQLRFRFAPDHTGERKPGIVEAFEHEIKVLQVPSGKEVCRIQATDVDSVSFSPDSRRLVIGGETLSVWEVSSGKRLLEVRERASGAVFSPDGSRIAYVVSQRQGDDGGLDAKIIDAGTGRVRRIVKGHGGLVVHVAFSGDGKRLVTVGTDRIKHWNDTGEDRAGVLPSGVSTSADGTRRAQPVDQGIQVSITAEKSVVLPSPLLARMNASLRAGNKAKEPFTGRLVQMQLNADGRRLVFWGCADFQTGKDQFRREAELRLWDVDAGRELLGVTESHVIYGAIFSPRGGRLAALIDHAQPVLKVWDAGTGRELFTAPVGARGDDVHLAFTRTGKRLAALVAQHGQHSFALTVWDTAAGREILAARQSLPANWLYDGNLELSPDGTHVAFSAATMPGDMPPAVVRLWHADSAKAPLDLKGLKGPVRSLAFSPDGRRLASVSEGNLLTLWSTETGAELLRLKLPGSSASVLRFTEDSHSLRFLESNRGSSEYEVRVLDGSPREPFEKQP